MPLFEAFNSFVEVPCILEGLRANRAHWLQQKGELNKQQTSPIQNSSAGSLPVLSTGTNAQPSATPVSRFQKKNTLTGSNASSIHGSKGSMHGGASGSGTPSSTVRHMNISKTARAANVVSMITTKLSRSNSELVSKSANALSAPAPTNELRARADSSQRAMTGGGSLRGVYDSGLLRERLPSQATEVVMRDRKQSHAAEMTMRDRIHSHAADGGRERLQSANESMTMRERLHSHVPERLQRTPDKERKDDQK